MANRHPRRRRTASTWRKKVSTASVVGIVWWWSLSVVVESSSTTRSIHTNAAASIPSPTANARMDESQSPTRDSDDRLPPLPPPPPLEPPHALTATSIHRPDHAIPLPPPPPPPPRQGSHPHETASSLSSSTSPSVLESSDTDKPSDQTAADAAVITAVDEAVEKIVLDGERDHEVASSDTPIVLVSEEEQATAAEGSSSSSNDRTLVRIEPIASTSDDKATQTDIVPPDVSEAWSSVWNTLDDKDSKTTTIPSSLDQSHGTRPSTTVGLDATVDPILTAGPSIRPPPPPPPPSRRTMAVGPDSSLRTHSAQTVQQMPQQRHQPQPQYRPPLPLAQTQPPITHSQVYAGSNSDGGRRMPPRQPQLQQQHQQHQLTPEQQRQAQYYRWQQQQHRLQQQQQQQQQPRIRNATPAWKSIWRKIERGLDGLADVEDAVSDRASQLYSNTVANVKVPTVKAPNVSAWKPRARRGPTKTAAPEQLDMSRFQRKNIPTKVATTTTSSTSTVSPLNTNRWATSRIGDKTTNKAAIVGGSRRVDWGSLQSGQQSQVSKTSRLIRANGGASTPLDDGVPSLPNEMTHSQQTQPPPPQPRPTLPTIQTTVPPVRPSVVSQPQTSSTLPPTRRLYPDEDETTSIAQRLRSFLPPIPRIRMPLFRRGSRVLEHSALDAWAADDEESMARKPGLFKFFRQTSRPHSTVPKTILVRDSNPFFTPPMADLMERCEGESASLLNMDEEDNCWALGRKKAMYDLLFLTFVLAGVRHMTSVADFSLPTTIVEALTTTISEGVSALAASSDTWAPILFMGAFLAVKTRRLQCEMKAESLACDVEASMKAEAQYGSLFLRIVSSKPVDRTLPEKMQKATRAQVAAKVDVARLQYFVVGLLAIILLTTVSWLQPLSEEMLRTAVTLITLPQWRSWPPSGGGIVHGVRSSVVPLFDTIRQIVHDEVTGVTSAPLRSAYKATLFAALLAVSLLPNLESKRQPEAMPEDREMDEAAMEQEIHLQFTDQVASLGASGADIVDLLAVDGRIDILLERWRSMIPSGIASAADIGFRSIFRLTFFCGISLILLGSPFIFYRHMQVPDILSVNQWFPQWHSFFDTAVVLAFTQCLVFSALSKAVAASNLKSQISGFMSSLVASVEERKNLHQAPPPALHLHASVSPTAGLSVTDLWASHLTKRAWAVRGTNLNCQSGEILLLLGDDGAGKSRLITTLAESVISPRAISTQRVRGTITVGGLDVTKWDLRELKRRVGISLCDARSVSDSAQLFTGLSLEDILDPCSGQRNLDVTRTPGPSEKAAMMLGLKITGLYSSLLRRLPSKMSTLVTASEEDMKPAPYRPRYQILSQSEWSKLLFARVLAQAIYDNENSIGTNDAIPKSLVGSVLLLDDLTLHFSEVEEAKILRDLRDSGAATVLSSNRWATGRFVDRIAVVKDGAIVETGTHNELLNRGPQQSIYAAKWHAMSSV